MFIFEITQVVQRSALLAGYSVEETKHQLHPALLTVTVKVHTGSGLLTRQS